MPLDEVSSTNSTIFLDVSISNLGETPSDAEEYGLKVILSTNTYVNGEELYFTNEYTSSFVHKDQQWLLDLKRPQLIAEKTVSSIPNGEHKRGWLAFRLHGLKTGQYEMTNIVFSFVDNYGRRIETTNGFWMGHKSFLTNSDDFTTVIPGAENIFYPVPPETNTAWLPPELPPGCSNVVVVFGANGINYTRLAAEISPEGTKFAIKDLPNFYLQNMDKMPTYSPRQKYMWIKDGMALSIGGKSVPYPVQPIIISNRLYVEVQVPFSNEKRKLVMSDDFDSELPIPLNWDRNYSTNYYANGIVSGGVYAYELVNELKNPVLQVAYAAPNLVVVNGIFQVDENSVLESFGQPPLLATFTSRLIEGINSTQRITTVSLQSTNFSEIMKISTNDSITSIGEMITNELYRPIFPGQRPLFKYPSNRYLGVLNDETNEYK